MATALQLPLPEGRHRILVCAAHFHPHVGGVERYTRELWGRLARRGHGVVVLATDADGSPREERVDELLVLRIPAFRLVYDQLPVPWLGPALGRALARVARWQPDVIVSNTRFMPATWLAALLARATATPRLHIEHGSDHVRVGVAPADWLSQLLDHSVGSWAARTARRAVGVSGAVETFLRHLGVDAPGRLSNGVDVARQPAAGTVWRQKLGIGQEEKVAGYLGRVTRQKGVETLVEAFARLGPPEGTHLVIAGDGEHLEALRRRAASIPRVHLPGRVPPEDVPALLAALDVFVHPSECAEGLPTTLLEAAAAGLPIVATSAGGSGEVLPDEDHGRRVSPGNPDELARAIAELLADSALARRLGAAARERALGQYDWEHIADRAEAEIRALSEETR